MMIRSQVRRLSVIGRLSLLAIALSSINLVQLLPMVVQPPEEIMGAELVGRDLSSSEEHPRVSSPILVLRAQYNDSARKNDNNTTWNDSFSVLQSTKIDSSDSSSPAVTITDVPTLHPPPRIFLGVLDTGSKKRQIFRAIFSEFNGFHTSTSATNRICSLGEFTTKKVDEWGPSECQLVYAFLLGGNETRSKRNTFPGMWKTLPGSVTIPGSPEMQTLLQKEAMSYKPRPWNSVLVLNANHKHTEHILWSWHQYVLKNWNRTFDFVAYSGRSVFLGPEEFLQNNIFSRPHGSSDNRTSNPPSILFDKEEMSLLSMDLVEKLAAINPRVAYWSRDLSKAFATTKITVVNLHGVYTPSTPFNFDFLKAWDEYKDSLIKARGDYQDGAEIALVEASNAIKYFKDHDRTFTGPRILMGIFSMDSEKEKERRAAVRSTYLSYYNESATLNRICSLHDLLKGALPRNGADCQMAYAFVMGGNPNGPTELLEPNSTFPLTVSTGTGLEDEVDIVHLNIRENMEDGKSTTWFKHSTSVIDEEVYFDYVGKTDTDTLIHPGKFLDETLAKSCPAFPDNARLYGGIYRAQDPERPIMIGPCYFAGELYWMSSDLARFVSSSELDRKAVDPRIEDLAMGNFVHSHPLPIRRVAEPERSFAYHKHPIKRLYRFHRIWANWIHNETHSPGRTMTDVTQPRS